MHLPSVHLERRNVLSCKQTPYRDEAPHGVYYKLKPN